jgi:HK97 family phage prohead protease
MKLHPKIAELQSKIGTTPIWRGNNLLQPEETRKANNADTGRIVKSYHCMFNEVDDRGTVFLPGAFKRSIEERGPKSTAKYKITVLWMHDQRDPIGLPTVLEERDAGLYAEWEADDVPNGDRAVKQIRSGTINNFSFGFNPIWDKMEYNEKLDVIEIREVELLEISPVTIGANMNTYAVRGTGLEDEDLIEDTEDFIRSIPRRQQLELRNLIDRHILLAQRTKNDKSEKSGSGIDYKYILEKLKSKK